MQQQITPNGALAVTVAVLSIILASCSQRPFLQARLCVRDQVGVSHFLQEMRSIAAAENLRFVDGSAQTARDLRAVGHSGDERTSGSPVIHIGIEGRDGVGMTAGNLGMPGYQVALGFSEGSSRAEAQRLAQVVISRLEQHWPVETVSPHTGVTPMQGCR